MQNFITTIQQEFQRNSNKQIAIAQKQYMKNKFEFYGLKAPIRKDLQKPFLLKMYLPLKSDLYQIVKELWLQPQRELQYFTMELVQKYVKQFEEKDIELLEFMIVNKSWWDTVDFIAVNLIGSYFLKFPEQIDFYINKWLTSDNIWLQRCTLLFQLKYKDKLNKELLSNNIKELLGSKEFFINKAIGWVLREYGKTNPNWVLDFVAKTKLSNLSNREALKRLK